MAEAEMDTLPYVSCLVPILDTNPRLLRQAIRGLVGQTYQNLEVVLCDNGSQASTLAVETAARTRWPNRVRLVEEIKKGTAYALDAGLAIAKGEYLNVAGSDDLFHPTWIEGRARALTSFPPQVAIVYEDYMMMTPYAFDLRSWGPVLDRNGKPVWRPQTLPIILPPYSYRTFLQSSYIPGVSMWRASVYDKIEKTFVYDGYEGRAGRHAEDYAHWLAITDYWDAFHLDTDPGMSWTYRVNPSGKYFSDRGHVGYARQLLQKRAWERRGL